MTDDGFYPEQPRFEPRTGFYIVLKATNFGDLRTKAKASCTVTRERFKGCALQAFRVTQQEGEFLHGGRGKCPS